MAKRMVQEKGGEVAFLHNVNFNREIIILEGGIDKIYKLQRINKMWAFVGLSGGDSTWTGSWESPRDCVREALSDNGISVYVLDDLNELAKRIKC